MSAANQARVAECYVINLSWRGGSVMFGRITLFIELQLEDWLTGLGLAGLGLARAPYHCQYIRLFPSFS